MTGNTIRVEEVPTPRFLYMGDDLRVQAEYPGTRLTPKFKFTYRPWDYGNAMGVARRRVKLMREHGKDLAELKKRLSNESDATERETLAELINDEHQVVMETVGLIMDCEAVSECVVDHEIVGPDGMKLDLKKLDNLKRLPHSVVRFMAQLIGETMGAPPIPTAAIDMVGKALGK